jgi:proteasome alpha subunit
MGLATAFSQTLGVIFTREPKPFEVEVLIVEISEGGDEHRLFRVTYDGTLYDERKFVAIGGKAEQLVEALQELWEDDMTLEQALEAGAEAFRRAEGREIEGWEAAVLDYANGRRAFRRLEASELPPR